MAIIKRNDNDNVIHATDFADTIYAYGGNDDIYGYGGNDTIYGGAGDDLIFGGAGNDDIFGGSGINDLYGGTGEDWFRMTSRSVGPSDDLILDFVFDEDRIDLKAWGVSDFSQVQALLDDTGNDSALLNAFHDGYDHFLEIDGVAADDFIARDFIFANPAAGTFNGTAFDDVLFGSRGADTINGNGGIDILLGGKGDDDMFGGNGNDELWGGPGADYLSGGADADIFGYVAPAETKGDVILDFQPGLDRIDLSRIDADVTRTGNQSFAWIGTAAFDAPGQLRFYQSGGDTIIAGNTDLDSTPEFRLTLDDQFALIRADFIL